MNVGPLFWKFNEYHYLLDGDETIDENVNVSARQKWGDFFQNCSRWQNSFN